VTREVPPAVDDGQVSVLPTNSSLATEEITLTPAQLVSMTESEYEEAVTALVELLIPFLENPSGRFSDRQPSAA